MSVYFRICFETTILHLLNPIIFTHSFIVVFLQNLFLISWSDTANPLKFIEVTYSVSSRSLIVEVGRMMMMMISLL